MKKIINIIYDKRTGEVIVEYQPTLDNLEIFDAMTTAIRIVYQKVMEEEARKRSMETTDMEKFVRLVAKQKDPKLN